MHNTRKMIIDLVILAKNRKAVIARRSRGNPVHKYNALGMFFEFYYWIATLRAKLSLAMTFIACYLTIFI
jgi:hypothetical protein